MATSASPGYFEPVRYGHRNLIDGASNCCCPAEIALGESSHIWPKSHFLDALVSAGTGLYEGNLPDNWSLGWWKGTFQQLQSHFDSNIRWEEFLSSQSNSPNQSQITECFFRLNLVPANDVAAPSADNYEELETLKNQTLDKELLEAVGKAKRRLWSSLFYFVPFARSYKTRNNDVYRLDGEIRCRLDLSEPAELRALQKLRSKIDYFGERFNTPGTTFQTARCIHDFKEWREGVGEEELALRCSIEAQAKKDFELVAILFPECGGGEKMSSPISGFPCSIAGTLPLKILFVIIFASKHRKLV